VSEWRKAAITGLLKAIETGDEAAVAVVNPNKYIQHNPLTREGGIGLAELFKRLAKTSPRVNLVRVFSDGDFVFAHTEYDFKSQRIGFEVFRFEGEQTVEHWDNIAAREGPNPSGRTMVDGSTEVIDLDKTEANRETVRTFVEEVLIRRQLDRLNDFVDETDFREHNPYLADGSSSLRDALSELGPDQNLSITYDRIHRLLAEGNFVLSICEGERKGVHSSYFDLFRLAEGKIVEHWDTVDPIPPREEWVNENGKF
jgi:predicted SnoaL-like aldol condensation-catalyzing enzyme